MPDLTAHLKQRTHASGIVSDHADNLYSNRYPETPGAARSDSLAHPCSNCARGRYDADSLHPDVSPVSAGAFRIVFGVEVWK